MKTVLAVAIIFTAVSANAGGVLPTARTINSAISSAYIDNNINNKVDGAFWNTNFNDVNVKSTNTQTQGITSQINPSQVVAPVQEMTIHNPEIPNTYNFVQPTPVSQPWLQFDMTRHVANTALSLFDTITVWKYDAIGDWPVPAGVIDKIERFATGKKIHKEIKVYTTRHDIPECKAPKTCSVTLLATGTLDAKKVEDVYLQDLEKAIMAKARISKANVVIKGATGVALETKQKTLQGGLGTGGTAMERFGSIAGTIGLSISAAVASGNAIPHPFIASEILEVE